MLTQHVSFVLLHDKKKANRQYIKDCNVECYNRSLDIPPNEENDGHADYKRKAIVERM